MSSTGFGSLRRQIVAQEGSNHRSWELFGKTLAIRSLFVTIRDPLPGSDCASVAQLAELRFCKPAVVGSSPTASCALMAQADGSLSVGVLGRVFLV